jgi:hypothetical protein
VLIGLILITLAVVVVVLFVAAFHKNNQISRLHRDGVPVAIRVTRCRGLLGGSGSNAAGYACQGSFTLVGHRYTEGIPGDSLHPPGTMLRGVAVPGDPALVTTAGALEGEHVSSRVFILPAALLVVLVLLVGTVVWRRRVDRG